MQSDKPLATLVYDFSKGDARKYSLSLVFRRSFAGWCMNDSEVPIADMRFHLQMNF